MDVLFRQMIGLAAVIPRHNEPYEQKLSIQSKKNAYQRLRPMLWLAKGPKHGSAAPLVAP
jgi:hypothetical protein